MPHRKPLCAGPTGLVVRYTNCWSLGLKAASHPLYDVTSLGGFYFSCLVMAKALEAGNIGPMVNS